MSEKFEYIKSCSVRIFSNTDGNKSVQTCKGTLSQNASGEWNIAYIMQSSAVKITLGETSMRMVREGDCYLDLTFDQTKEKTVGVIGLSKDTAGEIGIITKTLQKEIEGTKTENELNIKIKIILNYVLRYAMQDQQVALQLIADAR